MTIMVTVMMTIMYVERADSMRDARVKRLDDEGWLARNDDDDDNDDDVITISGSDKGCRYTPARQSYHCRAFRRSSSTSIAIWPSR